MQLRKGVKPDLDGAVLTNLDLSAIVLDNAQLAGATLRGCSLVDASIRRANLVACDLSGCDMRGSKMYFADLTDANLTNSTLQVGQPDSSAWQSILGCFLVSWLGRWNLEPRTHRPQRRSTRSAHP